MGVKDLFDTANVVTSAGTGAYRERVPDHDATVVRRIREAGAVIIGKTNTHELAAGGTTNNFHYGATRNPWDPTRVPGGSSGGSGAALAAGQALGALGTDTGGSIRLPAAFCGITGHRPTFGVVGRGGVVPLALTLDTAGPMARSAEDCALILEAIAGPDEHDRDSSMRAGESYASTLGEAVKGIRLAVVPSLLEGASEAVTRNFEASLDVLSGLGIEVDEAEPMAGVPTWRWAFGVLYSAEGARHIEEIVRARPQTLGDSVRRMMLAGLDVPVTTYVRALEIRKELEWRYSLALEKGGFAGYVVPTATHVAEPISADPNAESPTPLKFRNTSTFSGAHQPAISLPNGFDSEGLPTGLMIATAQFTDALTLRIGYAYQQVTDFHTRHPTVSGVHA